MQKIKFRFFSKLIDQSHPAFISTVYEGTNTPNEALSILGMTSHTCQKKTIANENQGRRFKKSQNHNQF